MGDQCYAPDTAGQTPQTQAKPKAVVNPPAPKRRSILQPPARPTNYYLEVAAVLLLAFYAGVAWWGTSVNDAIATRFAREYCMRDDSFFGRQFALCGAGDPTGPSGARAALVRESSSMFKFYASGRRYCGSLTATVTLRPRPDPLAWVLGLFMPTEDLVEVDVAMSEGAMQPLVLAAGTPRQIKALSGRADVSNYAKLLKGEVVPGWPAGKVQVYAENAALFQDLFTDPRVNAVFTQPAHAGTLRLFRSLLLTSEAEGSNKRLLRFVFALPPADDLKALEPLLTLVTNLIDVVGLHRLSPEAKKKATDARARAEAASAAADEAKQKRIEALAKRKMEKALEEKERISRLAPEARRKAEEKLAAKAAKKSMKVKMVRM
ncbi:hypothetical protein HYH03_008604 [Edaphochlamys debaryana]|uniref:Uncharacterized protein n=1 Tax=Edaphochlamys debaryana TaxID=47281 RepID=A0A835Y0R2_9CHLO|nr:hypothetical protein HYH03_008604 [Edaphochlamys debaryana]|eukprot:KAG2493184.1 hypothetical protein HYH03_008604 [Edaphochlamys debaryana]